MAVNLSIKNVPDDIAAALKERALRNHRSLQGELLAILERAARQTPVMSLDEIVAQGRRTGLRTPAEATEIVRDARDGRHGD